MEARCLVITGVVQGVGFRHHMSIKARELGIHGWVRNRRDGTVEAVISGDAEAIAAMIHWSRAGPPAAHVDCVRVEETEEIPLTGFQLRPTE